MSRSLRGCLASSLFFAASLTGFARNHSTNTAAPSLRITVYVYNLAQISSETLDRAKQEVDRIFAEAGVGILWVEFPVSDEKAKSHPLYEKRLNTTDYALRILPRSMAGRLGLTQCPLGLALPCAENDRGCVANVFFHRAEELPRGGDISVPQVLGHASAHELGHLLLRMMTHSSTGVMRPQWDSKDLRDATRGKLLFTPKQSELIRQEVLRRASLQKAVQVSGSPISQ